MAHDTGHVLGALIALSYTTTAAMAPQVPMSDEQVVGISIGAGLIGGLVYTLVADGAMTARDLGKRSLASAMSAPAIVAVLLYKLQVEPRLFGVVAVAGIAGLSAWPLAQAIPKLAPQVFRDWLRKVLGVDKGEKT